MSRRQPPFTCAILQAILIPAPTEIVDFFREARLDVVEPRTVKLFEHKARRNQRNDAELSRLILEDRVDAGKRQSVALIEGGEPVISELQGTAAVRSNPQIPIAVFAKCHDVTSAQSVFLGVTQKSRFLLGC